MPNRLTAPAALQLSTADSISHSAQINAVAPVNATAASKDLYRSQANRLGCTVPQLLHQLHTTQLYSAPTHANQHKYEPLTHSSADKSEAPHDDNTPTRFHEFQSESIIRAQQLNQLKEDVHQQLVTYKHDCTTDLQHSVDGWVESHKQRRADQGYDDSNGHIPVAAPAAVAHPVTRPSTSSRPKTSSRGTSSAKGRPKTSGPVKIAATLDSARSPLQPLPVGYSATAPRQSSGQIALDQILQRAKLQVAQQHSSPLPINHLIESNVKHAATHTAARPVTAFVRRPNSYDEQGITRIHDRLQGAGFATDLTVIQRALHPTTTAAATAAPRLQRPMTAPLTLRPHPFLYKPVEEKPKKLKKKTKKGAKPSTATTKR